MADWPQFRGPNSAGIATGPAPPIEFGPERNQLWYQPLRPGHSSPIIVGNRIFLTSFDKGSDSLLLHCLAKADGAEIWSRELATEKLEKGHPSFNPASSTPACDGEHVVAYFGSYGLVCYDMDGELQWEILLPLAKSYGGNAISPIIAGDRVILYRGSYDDHYLLAVDKATGQELWRTEQEERFTSDMACTGVPIVRGDKLLLHSARAIQAFELQTGKEIWQANCSTTATSTPVLAGDKIITATWNQTGEPDLTPPIPTFEKLLQENDKDKDGLIGRKELPRMMIFHRLEGTEAPQNGMPLMFRFADSDKDSKITAEEWQKLYDGLAEKRKTYVSHGLLSIDINSKGILDPEQIHNLERKAIPEVPSPLYHAGYVYFVKNGGIITCLDIKSGKRVYRKRTKGTGTHYASPIIAGDKLYSTAGNGMISVLTLGPKAKIVATNELGCEVYATPAVVDGVLYVRTHKGLYAFGESIAERD